jgi:hypothetical protein
VRGGQFAEARFGVRVGFEKLKHFIFVRVKCSEPLVMFF